MRYYIFTILGLLNLFQMFPQTISISGNVKDIKNSTPIQNSKIQIKNLQSGYIDSVFSNSLGNWQYDIITSANGDIYYLPENLIVHQNFPNPFNPSTKINFSIPNDDNISISVYNILGELIDHKNVFLHRGSYVIDWFSKGSAGVYFYTISFGDQSITKKMLQLDGGNGIGLGEIKSGLGSNIVEDIVLAGINLEIVTTKLGYAADSLISTFFGGENISSQLQTVHSKYTLIDLHNDVLEVMVQDTSYHLKEFHNYNHTDIPRLQQGEVDIQFFSIWVNPDSNNYTNYFQRALSMQNLFNSELALNNSTIAQAFNLDEAISINSQNKIAGVIGVEGGHHIENSLDKLYILYEAGMRYLTITWNNSTDWAISARDTRTLSNGLTEFGRQVIRKLDSLGVMIDVSHVGIKTVQDILTVTNNPIIATHSGVRALNNNKRNLYDWQIQDIANSGGVVGVVFYPYFLNGTSSASIADVIEHIDYIVNLVGEDFVAVGSDFDGIEVTPTGLEDVSKFPDLTFALLAHGYDELQVAKFLSGNFKRVFQQVCGNK